MSGLRLTIKRTRAADRAEIVYEPVRDQLVETSISATRKLYGHVAGNDPAQRNLRRLLWDVQSLLTYTLLPFDDPDLELPMAIQRLSTRPGLSNDARDDVLGLTNVLSSLIQRSLNLKFAALSAWCNRNRPYVQPHVLTALSSRPTREGWPDGAWAKISNLDPRFRKVGSLFEIKGAVLPLLAIPCSGRSLKGSLDLIFFSGIAERILFLPYDFESPEAANPPALSGGRQISSYRIGEHTAPPPVHRIRQDHEIEDPVWADLRNSGHTTDEAELVSEGRWVRFDDGSAVCLPDGASVPEVSEIIAAAGASGEARLPRRPVEALKPGHVLLLRVSGSGEYLDAVADALMKEAGEAGLRQKTEIWREALAAAIRTHGISEVGDWLRHEAGAGWDGLLMLPGYVSSHIIGPRSLDRFAAILRALARKGFLPSTIDDSYIQQHWETIRRIRSFQFSAGGALRSRLLKYLRHKIRSDGLVIGTPISLPDVDAGELVLLRVAAIDDQTCSIPTSHLYRLRH